MPKKRKNIDSTALAVLIVHQNTFLTIMYSRLHLVNR
jgi:hypothetical protein